jgi:tetratricopeptide (TPR) repeat protein
LGRGGFSRWGPVLLVIAVLAAGLGGAAAGLGAPAWLAGGVAAVTALVAGAFVGWYFPARDQQKARLEGRDQVLDELRSAVSAETREAAADPLGLLRADRSPMPFRGRGKEMRRLDAWRDEEGGSPVLLLSGSAGVGKSRLALEFASRVPEGWATGWLHAGADDTAIAAIAACGDPAVVLIDDADGRGNIVPLLDSLAERHGKPVIRVVLVTRSADGLRASLVTCVEERHTGVASGALAIELESEGSVEDRTRWFDEAVGAFATRLGKPAPVLPQVFSQADGAEPFVMIQARALLTVLGTEGDSRALTFGQVAQELMRHEKRRWDALGKARAWGSGGPPSELLRERAVAALALLGADSDAEAEEVLQRVPELRDVSTERRYEIAAWVSGLYPGGEGATPRIRPDVIGEWFVVSQLTNNSALAEGLCAGLTDDQAARALGFLARAADWIEAAGPLFGQFAGDNLRRQVLAAAQAALTGEGGRHLLDAVVAEQLTSTEGWSLAELQDLDELIPEHILLRTHAAIAAQVVAVLRAIATVERTVRQIGLAEALDNLGVRLDRVGQYQKALEAAEEAVSTWRAIAACNPAASQAGLAKALDNLGVRLDRLTRHQDALAAAEEAVATWRTVAADNPAAYQADFAKALVNLGVHLGWLGRYQDALTATEEAVAIWRAIIAGNPAASQAGLAKALDNLGVRLDRLGRYQDALEAAEEAVAIWRAIIAANPAAHQADLAKALDNLGARLDRLTRYQDALEAAEEAVALRRALAADNPAAHLTDLAMALDNLGVRLGRVTRHQDALTIAEEAVALRRALAADNPAAHQAGLAAALSNLSIRLGAVARYQDALTTTEEAVAACRVLAAGNPAVHQADLATVLGNFGVQLSRVGRYQEALATAEEAVALHRVLVADSPAAHQAGLATALVNLGGDLDRLDRHQEALDARTEAVSVYREMADRDPGLYQAEYRRRDGALRREYEQQGLQYEAITHDLKGARLSGETEP